MTDEELKQLVASLAISQQITEKQMQETDRRMQETDKKIEKMMQETDRRMQETDRRIEKMMKDTSKKIEELGKQIGGLGEKFGSFTEGMAFPSMRKMLENKFKMNAISLRHRVRKDGNTIELDVLAYNNGNKNEAIIIEVKSHLREEHIKRMLELLTTVKEYLPEHGNKRFYGLLAVVDGAEALKQQLFNEGLYYAEIHGDLFELKVPANFKPRGF